MSRYRLALLAALAAVAVLVSSAAAGIGTPRSAAITARADLDRAILAEVNAVRAANSLRPLRRSDGLAAAAERHSRTMAQQGFFKHESAGGGPFWRRVKQFYGSAGFRSWYVGENLLWVSPDVDAKETVSLWLESPRHREILLERDFREIGLAAVHASAAPGAYRGLEVTIVTADFGARIR